MPMAGQGEWWAGHISPLAAFDPLTNSALILDVWHYTEPLWVDLQTLLASTVLSTDADSKKPRGFVQIHKTRM